MTRSERGAVGRPRSSDVEQRAHGAVLNLYRNRGLQGVSFEQVARTAAVGKASLYSRWDSAEQLLVDALNAIAPSPSADAIDTGSVQGDLRRFIYDLIDLYLGPYGPIAIRINLDAQIAPDLRPYYNQFVAAYLSTASQLVRRAVQRGELREDLDDGLLLEQIFGATMLHVHFASGDRAVTMSQAGEFAETLVDNLLHGAIRR